MLNTLMQRVVQAGLVFLFTIGAAHAAGPIVDGTWLAQHLNDKQLAIVDMTEDDLQYRRFHIPGAVRLAYEELLKSQGPGKPAARLDVVQFGALLGRLGIARDTHVVIYDDMGGLNAGRLFLELEHIRHPRVSVLDGGLVQWVLDGRRVDSTVRLPLPLVYKVAEERRDNLATLAQVRRAATQTTPLLLDVRTRDEYTGTLKDQRSGHVPGAQWWPWEQAMDMDNGFTFTAPEKLESSLAKIGARDKQTPVILYCRSGHRASQSYLALRQLGFEDVRVYTGSMLDYLQDKSAPVTRGALP